MAVASTPTPATPAEYFDRIAKLVHELHDATHNAPPIPQGSRPAAELMAQLVDMTAWLANSTSWNDRRLYGHDKMTMRRDFDDRIAWRLL